MNWREHKKQLLKDPEFRAEYEALEPEYKLAAAFCCRHQGTIPDSIAA